MLVIGLDFESALRWRNPAIDNATHGKPALAEPESERLLFTAIAGVALHTNRHAVTIPPKPVQSDVRSSQRTRAGQLRAPRPQLCDADGRWIADYVVLNFAAMKAT
jgi:hypothetical protein